MTEGATLGFIRQRGGRAVSAVAWLAARLSPSSSSGVAVLLRGARAAEAKRDFRLAAEKCRAAIAVEPANPDAHAALAKALSHARDWPGAAAAARKFAELAPRRPSAKRLLGRALFQGGETDAAERVLSELLSERGNEHEARLYLAHIALMRGAAPDALGELDRMPSQGRFAAQRQMLRGDALMALSRLPEAAEAYEEARRLNPGRIKTLRQLAALYAKLGPSPRAESTWRELYRLRPNDTGIALGLARALKARGAFGEAETLLKGLIEREPGNRDLLAAWATTIAPRRRGSGQPDTETVMPIPAEESPRKPPRDPAADHIAALVATAIYAYRRDDFAGTIDAVERVRSLDPANVVALEVGGFAANRLASWPAAARFWGALAAAQPERRGPTLQHATALIESGDGGGALAIVEKLLRQDSDSAELIRMKLSALSRGQDEAGLDRFEVELAARPWRKADAPLAEAIAAVFQSTGKLPAARRWLERAHGLDATRKSVTRLRARIAYTEQQDDLADRLCATLEQDGAPAERIEARLIRARIAHRRGDAAAARAHYERAATEAPDTIEAVTYLVRNHLAYRRVAEAESLMAGVAIAGNEAVHRWWRALVLQAGGETERACGELLAALDANPADGLLRQRTIEFALETGRLDIARRTIARGLELEPGSLRLRLRLLQCRIRMDCGSEEIVEICGTTLAIDRHDEDALLQRGNAFTRLGRRREAIADFRAGIEAAPHNTTFWRSALASLLLLGEEADARRLLDDAKASFAGDSATDLAALADIFDGAELFDEARLYAEAALARDPDAQASRQLLARIETQRGRFDRAWPHLLLLQGSERRHIRTTRLFAQVAAGRAAASEPTGINATTNTDRPFPDMVFGAIVASAPTPRRRAEGECGPLRVLHVTSTLGPGGAERQLTNTLIHLAARGGGDVVAELAVEDVNPAHGRDFFLAPIRDAGIAIHCLDDERQAGNWRDMLALHPAQRGAVRAIASMPAEVARHALTLLPILVERRPDVVHLWQDSVCVAGGIAAALAGVPRIVLSTRSTRPVERQRARRYLEPGFRALLSLPRISLVNNSRNGAGDYERWLGVATGGVDVIHNGYDFTAIRRRIDDARSAAIRAELGIPAGAPVLGGVMRCSFEKRPELWTEAAIAICRAMPEAHAVLVGDGPIRGQIQARAAEAGLSGQIHFAGTQTPVEPWLRAMSVLFLSSLTEGLPNVLIEAQALGVPVATMRVGGAPETVIENETATVIDEGPAEAIAAALAALLGDAARREAYGRRAEAWVTGRFSIDTTVTQVLELYRAFSTDG